MAHLTRFARLVLTVPALLLGLAAAGCTTQVSGGGPGGGGGSGGSGGSDGTGGQGTGGAAVCTKYAGDGCTPDDTRPCTGLPSYESGGVQRCLPVMGESCATQWATDDCNTPLVLSFDGGPVDFLADGAHAFDVNGAASIVTDWPTAKTPWLALDRDGNGRIDDGSELFGSMSILASGRRAPNGFVALRELDANGDGRITPEDPGFARLLVWSDRDGDRRSAPGELAPAAAYELLSIDLDYTVDARCDAHGNCERERAAFRYRDAAGVVRTGAVIDVHLAAQR